jgi:Flp pilus assembly protein TadD
MTPASHTSSVLELVTEGHECLERGAILRAGELAGEALRLDRVDGTALHLAGLVEFRTGNIYAAIRRLSDAVAAVPDSGLFLNHLGAALATKERWSEARQRLLEAIECATELAEAHFNLGNLLRAIGDHGGALTQFREAVRIKPAYVEARFNLASALRAQGDLAEAEENYRQTLRDRPAYTKAWNNLGTLMLKLHRLDEAAQCFEQATQLAPQHGAAFYNLGQTLQRLGKADDAIVAFQRAVECERGQTSGVSTLG